MRRTATIQSAIHSELQQGPCPLDTLLARLPQYSWSEVFTVVDQLSREGRLVLRHPTRFHYEVSIDQTRPKSDLTFSEMEGLGDHAPEPDEQGVTP